VDDESRASLGPCPPARDVAKVVRLATECESNEHSEASWNGRVHTYLLDLAFDNETFIGKLGFLDWWDSRSTHNAQATLTYTAHSTRARIESDTLPLSCAGLPIESKMVDLAVYLESDDKTNDALRKLAARDPFNSVSWNQTCYSPLQKRPLAISFETKLTGRDWDSAKIQMSIWATAQLNKLERLVAQDGGGLPGLPFLPLVVIQGHEWYFMAATRHHMETVRHLHLFTIS
jgi:hypothetical protein